eukprot:gene15831-biopygen18740
MPQHCAFQRLFNDSICGVLHLRVMDTWQTGARGLGGWGGHAGLPEKSRKSSHQTRGFEKRWQAIWIEDFVSAIRSLKPLLWRGILWSTSGPALVPGGWGGHAGLPKKS